MESEKTNMEAETNTKNIRVKEFWIKLLIFTAPLKGAVVPVPTKKMRVALLPEMVRLLAPGPAIVKLALIKMRDDRVMVHGAEAGRLKLIRAPEGHAAASASAIWERRVPALPSSAVEVTVKVHCAEAAADSARKSELRSRTERGKLMNGSSENVPEQLYGRGATVPSRGIH